MNKITQAAQKTSEDQASTPPETAMVSAGVGKTVMLSELRFGRDYPGGSINVRKTNIGADEGLINSIRERGIDEALAVVEKDGLYYAADGDTRLDGAFKVVPLPEDRKRYSVNVVVHPLEHAKEISLAAGMLHRSLHPVDEFEALADLVQNQGKTVDELGRRFNMKVPQVRQALGLAALAPKIRQAWREGRIEASGAEAFLNCSDQKIQLQVFERLAKRAGKDQVIEAEDVTAALKVDDEETPKLLAFVGRQNFEAKGGRVDETLFSVPSPYSRDEDVPAGAPIVVDKPLLKSLAAEKMAEELQRLIAEGWAWAVAREDAPKDTHAWRVLDAKGGRYSKEQMAQSGVVVVIAHDGEFSYRRGLVKPGGKVSLPKAAAGETGAGRPKKPAAGKPGGKVDLTLSNNLMERLSHQLSAAISEALSADPRVALAAVLAGFLADDLSTYRSCVIKVSERGLETTKRATRKAANFERSFEAYLDAGQVQLLKVLAGIAGAAVDASVTHASHPPLKESDTAALCAALDASATGGQILQDAIRRKFDLSDYLNSVNKELVLLAIGEAVNADEARKLQGKPKSEVVKFALANLKPTGWLPKELRTGAYAGPGSGKTAKEIAAVAAANPLKAHAPATKRAPAVKAAIKPGKVKVKKSLRKKK